MSIVTKLDPRHWRTIRRVFNGIRNRYFTVNVERRQFVVDTDIETLRHELGRRHFTNAWELSYQYKGEDMNMRRPEYVDDKYGWYQLHIRGFKTGSGVELITHLELEPTAHPYDHIAETNYSEDRGAEMTAEILDDIGVSYERIES